MAEKDSHGVVIAYSGGDGDLTPIMHRPGMCWGLKAMKSEHWELFPNIDVGRDAGYRTCLNCLPDGKHDRIR